MEALLDFVQANPAYAAGAAALLLFVVVALVKKAAKLAVLALALNLGYGYYLNELAQDYYRQAQKQVAAAKRTVDKAGDLFEQAGTLVER